MLWLWGLTIWTSTSAQSCICHYCRVILFYSSPQWTTHIYFKRPSLITHMHLTCNFDNTSCKLTEQLSSLSTLLVPWVLGMRQERFISKLGQIKLTHFFSICNVIVSIFSWQFFIKCFHSAIRTNHWGALYWILVCVNPLHKRYYTIQMKDQLNSRVFTDNRSI